MLQAYSLCCLQQIKKPHHNQPSPHTEQIPLELTADVALIVNIKILPARERKSHDVTGIKCSFVTVSTLSCRWYRPILQDSVDVSHL